MKAVSTTIIDQQIADSYDYDSRIVQSQGYNRLYNALQLLQADPAVKVSLLTCIVSKHYKAFSIVSKHNQLVCVSLSYML